jgi:hypothetical protein
LIFDLLQNEFSADFPDELPLRGKDLDLIGFVVI